eukprot:2632990-Rhodomonas_salina.1
MVSSRSTVSKCLGQKVFRHPRPGNSSCPTSEQYQHRILGPGSSVHRQWLQCSTVVPHSSISNKILFEEHTGRRADVSWFRPFGCSVTVFRGALHVEHHKISP